MSAPLPAGDAAAASREVNPAAEIGAEFALPAELTPEVVEQRLRSATLFSARLQLFVASALVWLIFIFSTVSGTIPPLGPTILLSAWIIATTLALSYLAVRANSRFLSGPMPGRIALLTTLVTIWLATYFIRDAFGDFYHLYFFPIVVATIYFGLRGGFMTAFLCAASYIILVWGLNGPPQSATVFSLMIGRVVFLFAAAGTIGVIAEGRLVLTRELQQAFVDLKTATTRLVKAQKTLASRVREATVLDQVARDITSTLEWERVLRLVLERVETMLGAEAATLMLLDSNANELVFQIPLGSKGEQLQGYRLPVGQGIAGWVAQHGEIVRVDDVDHDDRHFQSVDEQSGFRTHSVLCVPMKIQDKVIGVIEVMNKKVAAFTADDERLLVSVARWAAIAMENARLFQDLQTSMDELRKAQEQLVRAERMRALGEMAGGVAHDFNNLLTIILAESQLLITRVHEERDQRSLQRIENAARDAAQAVRRVQEYSRVRKDVPQEVVDVNALVQQVAEITRPRWEAVGHVNLDLGPAMQVLGTAAELREVLTNLVFNSVDARLNGTALEVKVRTRRVDDRWMTIEVEDNGSGIPPEARGHIFDPYYTTKPHGTGLGLSITFGLIARHGGHIDVTSPIISENGSAPHGTRFTIRLPLTEQQPEREKMEKRVPEKRFGHILFVDDDRNVLEAASSLLLQSGYAVTTARTAQEAEARIKDGQFDVMMTDLTMPERSGWDLAREAKSIWPQKPVVLVTGWGLQLDAKQMKASMVDGVLPKPFSLDDLAKTLNSLSQARTPAKS